MPANDDSARVVIKVGGSLYDLPDLGPRLAQWLAGIERPLIVPGGGPTADAVRALDHVHQLGEETAHWLALRALTVNAHFLVALLGSERSRLVTTLNECQAAWSCNQWPVLDAYAFAADDEGRADCLPHLWSVTSDSIAVRVATVMRASSLILLKSVPLPAGESWEDAAQHGLVDASFVRTLTQAPGLNVIWINFRRVAAFDGRPAFEGREDRAASGRASRSDG